MVDFLVIGYINSISYNNIHPLVINGKFSFGYNKVISYKGEISAQGEWFSNISDYCPPPLVLKKDYRLDDYKRFDERPDIINIDRKNDIPDYDGIIGVPVSFIDKWDYRQFNIVDARDYRKDDVFSDMKVQLLCGSGGELSAIKGEKKFSRILIKKKIS